MVWYTTVLFVKVNVYSVNRRGSLGDCQCAYTGSVYNYKLQQKMDDLLWGLLMFSHLAMISRFQLRGVTSFSGGEKGLKCLHVQGHIAFFLYPLPIIRDINLFMFCLLRGNGLFSLRLIGSAMFGVIFNLVTCFGLP